MILCELRLARFHGTDKAEFLDQRQIRAPAFKLLAEAFMWLLANREEAQATAGG